ncbi:MAG: calcium/sodium antiporter [Kofleriaceae bacterium]|nr:MAG: calcium/sodium antiporter [Kofleriaceae bacterium]MBZ0237817.1 calcium/sodium antiporter [Kofleriaceae bacterium]
MGFETPIAIARLVIGLALLFAGGLALLRGSTTLARTLGISPLVIGLTVMAYGTSAPELAVSTEAAVGHLTPVALGNVIGACAANISLILGITALITPQIVEGRIIRREAPALLLSVVAIPITLYDGEITRTEGLIMVGCAVAFTVVTLTVSAMGERREDAPSGSHPAITGSHAAIADRRNEGSRIVALVLSAVGVFLIVAGSEQFVGGARRLAGEWGISERMLGMTIVALGTSMPELLTSVLAAWKGEQRLTAGTVIGSNLLNVFLVLGMVAYLNPVKVGERMHPVDAIGLGALTILAVVFMRGSRKVTRVEGAILVAGYVAFLVAAAIF